MEVDPPTMPVQVHDRSYFAGRRAAICDEVVLRAYEVYCELHGPQPAMIDKPRGCRGGFGVGELIAYLYAMSSPEI